MYTLFFIEQKNAKKSRDTATLIYNTKAICTPTLLRVIVPLKVNESLLSCPCSRHCVD